MTFHRFSRQEMLDLVWSRPLREIASDLGCSDPTVRKTCREAEIPTPPQGHWVRIRSGKPGAVKPKLGPRIFGAADEVTFGVEPWNRATDDDDLANPIPPPVFDEPLDSVRERAVRCVGTLAVPRDLARFAHDAVRRIMRDEARRSEWLITSGTTWSWEIERRGPRFDKPGDIRRMRLLSAIALGIERGGVRVRDSSGDDMALSVRTDGNPLALRVRMSAAKPAGRGEIPKQILTVTLSGGSTHDGVDLSWADAADLKLEARVQEIAIDCLVACEQHYRTQMRSRCAHREATRLRRIEERERRRIEDERKERERLAQMERERVERLLGEAEALRKARAIREYVAEVERLAETGAAPVESEVLARWRRWALAQADRLDPVMNGDFAKGMDGTG